MQIGKIHNAVSPPLAFTRATLEGEQCSPDDVVTAASRQDGYPASRVKQLESSQDSAQHRERSD